MKRIFYVLALLTSLFINNVLAATVSINPSFTNVNAPESIFVDINISGLQQPGGTDFLLGGWELDFTYDASVFSLIPTPEFGTGLGDIDLPLCQDSCRLN